MADRWSKKSESESTSKHAANNVIYDIIETVGRGVLFKKTMHAVAARIYMHGCGCGGRQSN